MHAWPPCNTQSHCTRIIPSWKNDTDLLQVCTRRSSGIGSPSSLECGTFIPTIGAYVFHSWYSSVPLSESSVLYASVTYDRVKSSVLESFALSSGLNFNGDSVPNKLEIPGFTFLLKMVLLTVELMRKQKSNERTKTDNSRHHSLLLQLHATRLGCEPDDICDFGLQASLEAQRYMRIHFTHHEIRFDRALEKRKNVDKYAEKEKSQDKKEDA
uniref:Uncharacterized protein n=1 Tax=Vitis vinifera TaxID=29760 RepID=A5AI00_VITVI|nr:hypothetical protein VITISV_035988 [Vitis vinifera]